VGHESARVLPLPLHPVGSRAGQLEPARPADVTDGAAQVRLPTVPSRGNVPAGAYVLIKSHDHAEDFVLCDADTGCDAGPWRDAGPWTGGGAALDGSGRGRRLESSTDCAPVSPHVHRTSDP
jgi:hypothetical protein